MEMNNNLQNKAVLTVLFLTVFIDLLGFGIVLPILPLYADQFGAAANEATLVLASYSLMQFLFAPVWGMLSDRYGRRPILLITLLGAVIAYIGLGMANSLWMLLMARGLAGVMAGNTATAQAYIADITTPTNRARGMGIIGAAFGLAFILGPAMGGILIGNNLENPNFQLPSWCAAGLSLFALVLALTLLPESLTTEMKTKIKAHGYQAQNQKTWLKVLQHPQILRLVGIYFLVTLAIASMESTLALGLKQQLSWNPQQTSYLFAFMGVVSTIIQGGLVGYLKNKWGETKLIALGTLGLAWGLMLLGFANSITLILSAIALVASGISITQPILNSLISNQTVIEQQGKMLGIASSASALARIGGPIWGGYSFVSLGVSAPFFSGSVIVLMAFVLSLSLFYHFPIRRSL